MITIRTCRADEVEILQLLNDEVFIDNAKYDTDLDLTWAKGEKGKKYFMELLSNKQAFAIIAENESKSIGYLAASQKHIDYRNSKYLEIENMGVVPEYRSQGVGKMLMEECFKWAKEQGYKKVFVNTYIANEKALQFYKNNGFDVIDISLEKTL